MNANNAIEFMRIAHAMQNRAAEITLLVQKHCTHIYNNSNTAIVANKCFACDTDILNNHLKPVKELLQKATTLSEKIIQAADSGKWNDVPEGWALDLANMIKELNQTSMI